MNKIKLISNNYSNLFKIFGMSVVIETSIGDLVIDLYTDERPTCNIDLKFNNRF